MKTFLGIGIFLIYAATDVLSVPFHSSSVVKRYTAKEEQDLQNIVNHINQKRREWAQQYQISNMHEMRYDTGLEGIAKTLTCKTMTRPGPNYLPAQFPDNRGLKLVQTGDEQQQIEAGVNLFGGFLAPEQTRFGCTAMNEPCKGPGGQVPAVCVTGPKATFNTWDAKRGPAGSQCNHGTDSSGALCKADESSSGSHFSAKGLTASIASSFQIYTAMILIILSGVN